MSTSIILIIVLVICIPLLIISFWLLDRFLNATPKKKKEQQTKKEEPKVEDPKSDKVAKTDKVVVDIKQEKVEVDARGFTPRVYVTPDKEKVQVQALPTEYQSTDGHSRRGQLREYYERRYRSNNKSSGSDDTYVSIDDQDIQLSQDDVKKLIVLRELFDKK